MHIYTKTKINVFNPQGDSSNITTVGKFKVITVWLILSWQSSLTYRTNQWTGFHIFRYHIETSLLILRANQLTGFC